MEKKQIELKIEKDKMISVFVDKKSKNLKNIEMIKEGVKKSFGYFDNIKKINFSVELIYSRDEFDQKIGYKTKNWVIGSALGDRFIIFSPEKIEEETNHKKNEFIPLITHEATHIFHKKINPKNFGFWLSEGIAQNIAGQEQKIDIEKKNITYFLRYCLFKNPGYYKFVSHQGYEISQRLVKFLMENYSKEQMIKLLKIKYNSKNSIKKDFGKILKIKEKDFLFQVKSVLEKVSK
jgi:hypothetical protein